MNKNRVYHKKKTVIVFFSCLFLLTGLIVRMVYLMVIDRSIMQKRHRPFMKENVTLRQKEEKLLMQKEKF